MILDTWLQEWLDEAMSEKYICTVEASIERMITDKEKDFINDRLKPLGFKVGCFKCEVCAEYSNGIHSFHIERVELR